jgi:hypothetical protein
MPQKSDARTLIQLQNSVKRRDLYRASVRALFAALTLSCFANGVYGNQFIDTFQVNHYLLPLSTFSELAFWVCIYSCLILVCCSLARSHSTVVSHTISRPWFALPVLPFPIPNL